MKAVVQDRYGPPREVLQLRDIDVPVIRDDEVLVRVHAASVHPDVWHVVTGRPFVLRLMGAGLRRPKTRVPGTDLAGCVESVGRHVTRFKPGDAVFGESHAGMQWRNGGAFAEYAAVPQSALALKPDAVTFSQAAAVPTSGIIALINLRDGALIEQGHRVLINGAGGNVGSIALQLAKAQGAHVTAVDSRHKLELIRSLGADEFLDYERDEVIAAGARYDLIFDVASTLSLEHCRRVLSPEGLYVRIGHDHFGAAGGPILGSLPGFARLVARSSFDRQLPKPTASFAGKTSCMEMLRKLLQAGKLTPIVDRSYPLAGVADAIQYLASGMPRGRLVVEP